MLPLKEVNCVPSEKTELIGLSFRRASSFGPDVRQTAVAQVVEVSRALSAGLPEFQYGVVGDFPVVGN